jgi:ParB family chromosome partitioning protein
MNTETASIQFTANLTDGVETVFIPLKSLYLSPSNVRKAEPTGIEELSKMIESQGLLNPLFVTRSADEHGEVIYFVEAGGRRLRALQLLREKGQISKVEPVQCRIISKESALEISLAENISQSEMHPADEFQAYSQMVKSGYTVDAVSNKFGVTPVHVQRRLKMASVAPELLNLYRKSEMTLEQVMALAATDDKKLQVQVWNSLPSYQRNAYSIKKMMFQGDISSSDKRLNIVSLAEYKDAGGHIRVDLFSKDGDEIITDGALLDELVHQKLEEKSEALLKEGWAWVEISREETHSYSLRTKFNFPKLVKREPNEQEQRELDELERAYREVGRDCESISDDETPEKACERESKLDELSEKINDLRDSFYDTSYPNKQQQGVVVAANHSGIECFFGLTKKTEQEQGSDSGDKKGKAKEDVSDKMALDLGSHFTAALQSRLIDEPNVALAALASRMAISILARYASQHSHVAVGIELQQDLLTKNSNSVKANKGFAKTQAEIEKWQSLLPKEPDTWLDWFLSQPVGKSTDMIVLGTALSTRGMNGADSSEKKATGLAKAVNLDMADFWEASNETYLSLVPKAKMLDAVTEVAGSDVASPMQKMKKDEAATFAQSILAGKRWLPKALKIQIL